MSTLVRKHVERVLGIGPHTIRHDLATQWVQVTIYDRHYNTTNQVSILHVDENTLNVEFTGLYWHSDGFRQINDEDVGEHTIVVIG